ncbi:MAG TPA: response regulator transcription factor [Usitatibacteraceae bacterium]
MTSTVMVVDDHAIVLHGLCLLINNESGLKVTLQAESGEQALELLKTSPRPDLVVTDISLPGISGIELTKQLTALYTGLPILVLSMHDELIHGERAFRAGARGYLTKQEATDKVVIAVRRILEGKPYMSERMESVLHHTLRVSPKSKVPSAISKLTDREFEIFRMIGLGLGSAEIAQKLERSIKTIEAHRANMKKKLGMNSMNALNRFAVSWADRDRV